MKLLGILALNWYKQNLIQYKICVVNFLSPHLYHTIKVAQVEALTVTDRCPDFPQVVQLHSDGSESGRLGYDDRPRGVLSPVPRAGWLQEVVKLGAGVPQIQRVPRQQGRVEERVRYQQGDLDGVIKGKVQVYRVISMHIYSADSLPHITVQLFILVSIYEL